MDPKTTRTRNDTPVSGKLYLAFELSESEWKLGFTIGLGQAPRLKNLPARNLDGLKREIEQARVRFGLSGDAGVLSCYEAGRDGFWLHRYLEVLGVKNRVVDSASIEVNRRYRRMKTDRLDVGKLLNMLVRYDQGETRVWSVVHVPHSRPWSTTTASGTDVLEAGADASHQPHEGVIGQPGDCVGSQDKVFGGTAVCASLGRVFCSTCIAHSIGT